MTDQFPDQPVSGKDVNSPLCSFSDSYRLEETEIIQYSSGYYMDITDLDFADDICQLSNRNKDSPNEAANLETTCKTSKNVRKCKKRQIYESKRKTT